MDALTSDRRQSRRESIKDLHVFLRVPSFDRIDDIAERKDFGFEQRLQHRFKFHESMGAENEDIVYRVVEINTGEVYALKVFRVETAEEREEALKQVELLKRIDHYAIAKFYEYIDLGDAICIVQEFIEGSTLQSAHLTQDGLPIDEFTASVYILQLLEVCQYLHEHNIIHNSLIPKCVRTESDDVTDIRLINFWWAEKREESEARAAARRPSILVLPSHDERFTPPEAALAEPLGHAGDIWEIGVFAYYLLSGEYPFEGSSCNEVLYRISLGEFHFSQNFEDRSDDAKNFVKRLLQKDPKKRPNAIEALSDPWIEKAMEELRE